MKAVILAGGFGTRISEESTVRPKPMVEVGDRPILWHIMKIYEAHGITEFVIAAGYKSYMLKEYFANYFLRNADVTFDLARNGVETHAASVEPWRVTIVDTGERTMTGGRLKRLADYIDDTFCMTYGDCVGDIDISALVAYHREHGATATMTAVQPPGRFGVVTLTEDAARIATFHEKPEGDGAWVNGGYFVLEPEALDVIQGDDTVWEREPLERLALEDRLAGFRHTGFWQPMDTLRDRMVLEELWASGAPPWKVW